MSTQAELLTALAEARGLASSHLPDNNQGEITPGDLREALIAYDQIIEDIILSVQHFDTI
jgi:hypothetical protein